MKIPPAPAFPLGDRKRSDYPLSGTKVGPLWRGLWDKLIKADRGEQVYAEATGAQVGRYLDGPSLAQDVAFVLDGSVETARTLLIKAAKAGVLRTDTHPVTVRVPDGPKVTRNRTFYAIAPEYRHGEPGVDR